MHRSGLTELEVVMAVVRRGSFRGAAQELGMSATAVSNAIAGLESRLETRLLTALPAAWRSPTPGSVMWRASVRRCRKFVRPGRDPQRHRRTRRHPAPERAEQYWLPVSGPAADRLYDPLPENARGNGERGANDRYRRRRLRRRDPP